LALAVAVAVVNVEAAAVLEEERDLEPLENSRFFCG